MSRHFRCAYYLDTVFRVASTPSRGRRFLRRVAQAWLSLASRGGGVYGPTACRWYAQGIYRTLRRGISA
jgi:hypothetical protein